MSSGTHGLRAVAREPGFRRLLAVRMTGQLSDGVFQAALFAAVFFNPEKATSAAQAATAFATLLLPYSLVGPFAGVFLDRWRRQRVLVWANAARAVTVVLFAVSLTTTGPTSALTVAVALVVVSANRFVLSGLSAALPHVVDLRHLVVANSTSTTLGAGAAAVGGVVAVALRVPFGEGDTGAGRIALVAGALYLLAGGLASRFDRDLLGPDDPPLHLRLRTALAAVPRGVAAGAAHVRARGQATRALVAISAHRFFYGLSFVATLLLYTEQGAIPRGISGLSQVIAVAVLGGLVAAVITPVMTRRLGTQRWIVVVFAAAAVVEVVFGLPYTHPTLLVAAFFLGLAAQASKICVDTLLQEAVDDDFRGRVFSFYDTMFNLSFVSAAAAAAVLVPPNGKSYLVIAVIAIGYAVTAAAYGVACARRADVEPEEPVVTA